MRDLKKDILSGALEPRSDIRNLQIRSRVQSDHVDAWFNWLYEFVAEDLATSEVTASKDGLPECDDEDFIVEASADPSIVGKAAMDTKSRPERFLSPGRIQELWEFYSGTSTDGFACVSTFSRVYRENWRSCLKFRPESEHARCHQCAVYSKLRQLAKTTEQKSKALDMHVEHVRGMYADRAVYARIQTLSVESTKFIGSVELAPNASSVLTLSIDGMDQVFNMNEMVPSPEVT